MTSFIRMFTLEPRREPLDARDSLREDIVEEERETGAEFAGESALKEVLEDNMLVYCRVRLGGGAGRGEGGGGWRMEVRWLTDAGDRVLGRLSCWADRCSEWGGFRGQQLLPSSRFGFGNSGENMG